MPMTRAESDAWRIMQGATQERLDRIHTEADAMRARLEAEGRGPSTVWEPVSSDNDEFEDSHLAPMTPPVSPPWTPRGATSKGNNFVNLEIQQHSLSDPPSQNVRPALSTSPRSQVRKVQHQIQRRAPVLVSWRITRSKSFQAVAFYELARDNKTSRIVSNTTPINPTRAPDLYQPKASSPRQNFRPPYRIQKR